MGKVRVSSFAVSLDGFSAGPNQDLENPLGVRGPELMDWYFPTRTWKKQNGMEGGETGIDDAMASASMSGVGAWILGRNMFGPIRGPWPDDEWKGWWGEEPPYHVPTFVLTHYPRDTIHMKGGTEFRFITDGIHSALEQAREAAGDLDVRIGGGASTIRQYLKESLIDELHIPMRPVLLGQGESLFNGLDMRALGYESAEYTMGERAVHAIVRRKSAR